MKAFCILIFTGSIAMASDPAASLLGMRSQTPVLNYEGRQVGDNGNAPSLSEHSVGLSAPVFKDETDSYATSLSAGSMSLGQPVSLDSGRSLPDQYYKAEAGLNFSRKLSEQRSFGLRGTVGYAGDKINSSTETFTVTANYSFPTEDKNMWVLMLLVSNNGPFGAYVPVPGFFYIYRTPTFNGIFGLPVLSLQWTPETPWTFSFSMFGPQLKAQASYGAPDALQYFSSIGWRQTRFILSDRLDNDERLAFEEKNLEAGIRSPLWAGASAEFITGYLFDRSAYAGDGLFNKDGGNARFDSNGYLKWSLRQNF